MDKNTKRLMEVLSSMEDSLTILSNSVENNNARALKNTKDFNLKVKEGGRPSGELLLKFAQGLAGSLAAVFMLENYYKEAVNTMLELAEDFSISSAVDELMSDFKAGALDE